VGIPAPLTLQLVVPPAATSGLMLESTGLSKGALSTGANTAGPVPPLDEAAPVLELPARDDEEEATTTADDDGSALLPGALDDNDAGIDAEEAVLPAELPMLLLAALLLAALLPAVEDAEDDTTEADVPEATPLLACELAPTDDTVETLELLAPRLEDAWPAPPSATVPDAGRQMPSAHSSSPVHSRDVLHVRTQAPSTSCSLCSQRLHPCSSPRATTPGTNSHVATRLSTRMRNPRRPRRHPGG